MTDSASDKNKSCGHEHMLADFKRRFWISLAATIPVLALSPMIQSFLNFGFTFPYDSYILWAISTFVFLYGGYPFLKGLVSELKEKLPGMMTLIALAITVAYSYSSLVTFGLKGEDFFWELVTLIDIMLLGHWIEMRSVMAASMALENLAKLMPNTAHRKNPDGSIQDVEIDLLCKGDIILVKPAEKIPADGSITEGQSEIDLSMITGESAPVEKQKDDQVIAGSVNGTGALTIHVDKTQQDSYLSRVIELVKKASQTKSRAQSLADKAAFWLTIIAISAGALTLTAWLVLGKQFAFALERTVTVMVITCPHALGLAVPLVIAVITTLSAKNGLLIRNRTAFESARNTTTVVFDKTGTLTKGQFGVTDIISFDNSSEDDILAKAAAIEQNSEHSIAKAIVQAARDKSLTIPQTADFKSIPGKGAKASIDGKLVFVGSKRILEPAYASLDKIEKKIDELSAQGKTIVILTSENKPRGLIALADIVRDQSKEAVKMLKDMGIEIAMITGDNLPAAQSVARQLGIDTFFADVLPDKKSEKIKELSAKGKKVIMVGDGINDAPALAAADIGIAIGAGTDIAAETADVVLVESDPRSVVDVIRLSKITNRKMLQNLAWATGYNVIAIPLAAGVLFSYGIIMPPAVGAVIMSVSTIVVAINAKITTYKKTA